MTWLQFKTQPPATILLDGMVLGRTPGSMQFFNVNLEIPMGEHTVHAVEPGWITTVLKASSVPPIITNNEPVTYTFVYPAQSYGFIFEMERIPVAKTVTVRASVLAGFPAPSLDIDIFANGLVKSKHWDAVARGESVSESVELDAGTYDVFARARLSNAFGSVEEESPHQTVVV